MKHVLTILLLTFTHHLFSQVDSLEDNQFCFKITPVALVDVFGGTSCRLGTEFKLKDDIAGSLEYGKYFGIKNFGLKAWPKGDIIRVELKFYTNDDNKTIGDYFSFEYLYKHVTFNYWDSIRINPNPTYQKEYTIEKEISAVTFKWGSMNLITDRLIFEWYAGVGLRFFTCGNTTLTDEEKTGLLTGEGHGDLIGAGQRANHPFWFPNLSLGIKLGYKIF